jgi:hypothetical protein
MPSSLSRRLKAVEEALKPQAQEIWIAIERYACLSEADIAREQRRQIRAVLGRDAGDEDTVHCYLLQCWGACPPGAHSHDHPLNGGVVQRRR